uniref:Ovule protein n=1 Tax=Heterorhabditis bacteriophora TaxID=37862 RepID=A0A1I7WG63_HETBA
MLNSRNAQKKHFYSSYYLASSIQKRSGAIKYYQFRLVLKMHSGMTVQERIERLPTRNGFHSCFDINFLNRDLVLLSSWAFFKQ